MIPALRAKGIGWQRIAAEMGVGAGTLYRVALEGSKTGERFFEPQLWVDPTLAYGLV
jgi:hypothetical protein